MKTVPLTQVQADAVWDLLVAEAGANPGARDEFCRYVTDNFNGGLELYEYRFMGLLGFGGKFKNGWGQWYVAYYVPEDDTVDRRALRAVLNERLAALKEELS